jgi:hypothetical protein
VTVDTGNILGGNVGGSLCQFALGLGASATDGGGGAVAWGPYALAQEVFGAGGAFAFGPNAQAYGFGSSAFALGFNAYAQDDNSSGAFALGAAYAQEIGDGGATAIGGGAGASGTGGVTAIGACDVNTTTYGALGIGPDFSIGDGEIAFGVFTGHAPYNIKLAFDSAGSTYAYSGELWTAHRPLLITDYTLGGGGETVLITPWFETGGWEIGCPAIIAGVADALSVPHSLIITSQLSTDSGDLHLFFWPDSTTSHQGQIWQDTDYNLNIVPATAGGQITLHGNTLFTGSLNAGDLAHPGLSTTINYQKYPSGNGTLTFTNGLLTGAT